MTNNLKHLKQELKSFAKRVKDFKYTDSALISFLLTGAIGTGGLSFNLFSAQDEIKEQTKVINNSIGQLKQDFKKAREQNNKLLRNTNLELIQLTEQGDHVVKSPWSSWQYGINGIYNNWQGHYKGRGDKTPDVKYERDKTMGKYKYNTTPNTYALYGNTTELGLKREPNAMIPVSASLTPLVPKVKVADVSMAIDISNLPSFTPRTVKSPQKPEVTSLGTVNEPVFEMNAVSIGNETDKYFYSPYNQQSTSQKTSAGRGIIEPVAVTSGNIIAMRENIDMNSAINQKYYTEPNHGIWHYSNKNLKISNVFRGDTMQSYTDSAHSNFNVSGWENPTATLTINKSATVADNSMTAPITSDPKTGFFKMTGGYGSPAKKNKTTGELKPTSQPAGGSFFDYSAPGKTLDPDDLSILYNNANVVYTRKNQSNLGDTDNLMELAHLDLHYASTIDKEKNKLNSLAGSGVVSNEAKVAFDDASKIAIFNNSDIDSAKDGSKTMAQTFINNSKIILEGRNIAFSNSYDHFQAAHFGADTATNKNYVDKMRFDVGGIVINTGDIVSHPYQESGTNTTPYDLLSAAFIVSKDTARGDSNSLAQYQILYNSGNIALYNKKSSVFFLNPNENFLLDYRLKFDPTGSLEYSGNAGTQAPKRPITVVNRNNIKLYGENSVGVYVKTPVDLTMDFKDNAGTNFKPMNIYGDESVGLFVQKTAANERATVNGNFAVNIGDSSNKGNQTYTSDNTADLDNAPTDKTTTGNYLTAYGLNNNDPLIENSYGIFAATDIDFSQNLANGINGGHQIVIYGNSKNNIGVLTSTKGASNDGTNYNLGSGIIGLKEGLKNIGIALNGQKNAQVTADKIVMFGGDENTAIYAMGDNNTSTTEKVTVNSVNEASVTSPFAPSQTRNSIAIYAAKGSNVTVNKDFKVNTKVISAIPASGTSTQNAGGVYATGNKTVVTLGATTPATRIEVEGADILDSAGKSTGDKAGFGLFADGGAKISAIGTGGSSLVKVKNGSAAVVSLGDTGTSSEINLTGATVDYDGEGYALYTDKSSGSGSGAINMTNATLDLRGKAVGYVNDRNNAGAVTFNNTTINVYDNDVIIADLKDTSGNKININIDGKTTLKSQLIGSGIVAINDKTKNAPNGTFKYAVVDGAKITISSAIDRSDNSGTDTDSEVFSKRFLYQNSIIDVDKTGLVKAELNDSQLQRIDTNLKTPVGLAVTASAKTENTSTTGINNSGKIEADRTVGTDKGGIGLYVDYGFINNNSTGVVNVEKGTVNAPNEKAIGIFGTNSTKIVNDGQVNAGGKKSIGILGLSYRIDSATGIVKNPKDEPYYDNVVAHSGHKFGIVNVENSTTGKITMDGDGAVGMFIKNNSNDKNGTAYIVTNALDRRTKNDTHGINKGEITINGSSSSVGMGANNGIITNDTTGKITVNGTKSAGMYGTNESDLINNGEINVAATSAKNESIGMYIDDQKSTITNTGKINVGKSSYGIFGKKVDMTSGEINVDDNGVGVYSTGPAVNLTGGKINVANNNAVGVYIADDATNPQPATVTGNVDMKVGDTDSFGYLITAKNAKTDLTTHAPNDVHIGEKSVYIYSGAPKALGGKIENYSNIVTDKNNGYGIYSSQDSINYGNIDLRSGDGNIGIYSTQGVGKNYGTITVGTSNIANKQYGIGMATGYYDETAKATSNVGTIENYGTINVSQENSVGMYAVGKGSTAINRGTINLDGKNTTGMYIDRDAVGENYGVIQTTPTANGTGIKGVVVTNGGIIKNYGTINVAGNKNMGVYVYKGSDGAATYEEYGSNTSTRPFIEGTATDQKVTGSAVVKVPPASLPSAVSISVNGVEVTPVKVNTSVPEPKAPEVTITDLTGVTTLNLATEQMDHEHTHSNAEISSLGMYVDTSGINYTKPIQGLSNLYGLTDIDLIMGTEVTKYLNAKAIQIGDNILKPYNDALAGVVSSGVTLNVNSASLTWIAQPVESKNINAPIKTVYMVKIPYTDFASENDTDTAHFLDGLEQRYGVEDIHSREKQIFNKLNSLGKGENHIFAQAVNEMKGYEYSNTQMRINSTGNALDKEFKYLHDEWRNPSKQNNKIKVFGQKDEFNTDTAGVIDYDSNAYGVAYVHEDEAVTLGNSTGWYAGAVSNRFKFKDLGKSAEQQSMIKAGLFKTMSPVKDHNGSLRWTIAGDVFGGVNNMHRKFWVVDDVFESKADYYSYGAALKTDLGYDIRLSERTHLRPYGALKMEYGRFSSVKEDRGQMNLEVKGNDYFSVKPEVGAEFKYVQPLAVRTQLSVGLSAAYENELGKLNRLNQARVRYTTADWYNLRNEKEDRHGNGKFDLNLGIDNTRFGVTVNAGYDTKGENIRGGLGFRLIY